jgi:uncharacterized membrane protein
VSNAEKCAYCLGLAHGALWGMVLGLIAAIIIMTA